MSEADIGQLTPEELKEHYGAANVHAKIVVHKWTEEGDYHEELKFCLSNGSYNNLSDLLVDCSSRNLLLYEERTDTPLRVLDVFLDGYQAYQINGLLLAHFGFRLDHNSRKEIVDEYRRR